jgi:uncharacterized membrane protein
MHAIWELFLRVLLWAHVTCGSVAFVCAPVALLTAKGGRTHRRWGKIYFRAMAGVAATALVLSIALPIVFLALAAVFSFYATFSAYRILFLKDLVRGVRARWFDWAAALVTFAASAGLAWVGYFRPRLVPGTGVIAVIFGVLGMVIAGRSLATVLWPPEEKQFWWYLHMRGMIASYIATVTAFVVVNLVPRFGNTWWLWLGPVMVGVPALLIWQRYYRGKFQKQGPRGREHLTAG